ncbi:MAG: glycosyltransferase [Planctomycetota bacterium]|nr:glycosyltransferase [Planctomycetota bacterium]
MEEQTPPPQPADMLLSVLALVRNDRAVLRAFVEETQHVLQANYAFYEIVFVDLQSTDGSLAELRALMQEFPCIRLIRLSTRSDNDVGVTAALEHCIGDMAVVMDLYLDSPADIPKLVATAQSGFDVVVACREGGPSGRFGRNTFYRFASWMLKKELNPDESDFRLLTRKVIAAMTKIKHRRRHLRYFTALMGFKKASITCTVSPRATQFHRRDSLLVVVRRSLDMLISNSAMPLRLAAGFGLLASFGNLVYLLYVLAVALLKERLAEGWLTTAVIMSTMFFGLFFMLSVLSEYVARILEETQTRPLYFIEFEEESSARLSKDHKILNVVEAS